VSGKCTRAREVLETKRGISALNWKDTGSSVAAGFSPAPERVGGGFRAAGQAAQWAGLGLAHGAIPPLLPGLARMKCAALFGLSDRLGELDEQIRQRCGKELLSAPCSRRENTLPAADEAGQRNSICKTGPLLLRN